MSGQRQQGGRVLAGFWRRALAAVIDALLVAIVALAAEWGYLASTGGWSIELDDPGQPIVAGAVLLAAVLYDLLLTWRIGGTLGKRAVGVRVQAREGGDASFGQVLARSLARVVSALPALLGFFWAGWDRRKQTWHDKLADTVVVRDDVPVARPVAAPSSSGDSEAEEPSEPPAAEPQPDPGPQPRPEPQSEAQPEARPDPQPEARPEPQSAPAQPWPPTPAQPAAPPPQPSQPVWSPQQSSAQTWAPQAPQPAPQPVPQSSAPVYSQPSPSQPPMGGLTPPPPMPARNDPNGVAIGRAGLGQDAAMWLQQVADQVDARLDRVSTTWRTSPHAEAARACAFGLLLGHLARLYPHMRPELNATAELHPSFSTLLEGSRLATLEQIVAEPGRIAAWLGPLIDVHDPARIQILLD